MLGAAAVLIGKTNLDQFATGLVGIRNPYGTRATCSTPRWSPTAHRPARPSRLPRGSCQSLSAPNTAGVRARAGGVRQHRRVEANDWKRLGARHGAGVPFARYDLGVRPHSG
jgi:hypothetical protein